MQRHTRNTLFKVSAWTHLIVQPLLIAAPPVLAVAASILMLVPFVALVWSSKRDHDRRGGVAGRNTTELLVIYAGVVAASVVLVIASIVFAPPRDRLPPLPPEQYGVSSTRRVSGQLLNSSAPHCRTARSPVS